MQAGTQPGGYVQQRIVRYAGRLNSQTWELALCDRRITSRAPKGRHDGIRNRLITARAGYMVASRSKSVCSFRRGMRSFLQEERQGGQRYVSHLVRNADRPERRQDAVSPAAKLRAYSAETPAPLIGSGLRTTQNSAGRSACISTNCRRSGKADFSSSRLRCSNPASEQSPAWCRMFGSAGLRCAAFVILPAAFAQTWPFPNPIGIASFSPGSDCRGARERRSHPGKRRPQKPANPERVASSGPV